MYGVDKVPNQGLFTQQRLWKRVLYYGIVAAVHHKEKKKTWKTKSILFDRLIYGLIVPR